MPAEVKKPLSGHEGKSEPNYSLRSVSGYTHKQSHTHIHVHMWTHTTEYHSVERSGPKKNTFSRRLTTWFFTKQNDVSGLQHGHVCAYVLHMRVCARDRTSVRVHVCAGVQART